MVFFSLVVLNGENFYNLTLLVRPSSISSRRQEGLSRTCIPLKFLPLGGVSNVSIIDLLPQYLWIRIYLEKLIGEGKVFPKTCGLQAFLTFSAAEELWLWWRLRLKWLCWLWLWLMEAADDMFQPLYPFFSLAAAGALQRLAGYTEPRETEGSDQSHVKRNNSFVFSRPRWEASTTSANDERRKKRPGFFAKAQELHPSKSESEKFLASSNCTM